MQIQQTIVVGGQHMNEKIIAVKHRKMMRPVAYKTNLGNIYNYNEAIEAVENGKIDNAYIETDSTGTKNILYKK